MIFNRKILTKLLLAVSVTCVGVIAWLILFLQIKEDQNQALRLSLESNISSVKNAIENRYQQQVNSLIRMGKRMEDSSVHIRKYWEMDAENYVKHDKTFISLEWVDKDQVLRWIVPTNGHKNLMERKTIRLPENRKWLDAALMTKKVITLAQKTKFFIIVPLFKNNILNGYLIGVFDIKKIIDTSLASFNLADSLELKVFQSKNDLLIK